MTCIQIPANNVKRSSPSRSTTPVLAGHANEAPSAPENPRRPGVITTSSHPSVFIHNPDDGWTSTTGSSASNTFHLKNLQMDMGRQPLPQISDNGQYHAGGALPMVAGLQNGMHPISPGPWFSMPQADHHPRFLDSSFIAGPPPPASGPSYPGGYMNHGHIEQPHMHTAIHHNIQRHFHCMPQMDKNSHMTTLHSPNHYNNYYPSEYGNYFSAQPAEPFSDHSFAFHPLRPQQPLPFLVPPRDAPVNSFNPNNQHDYPNLIQEVALQHTRFPFEYPSPLPPPQFFFPPQILPAPQMPQCPIPNIEMVNQSMNENVLPSFRQSSSPKKLLSSSPTHLDIPTTLSPSSSLKKMLPRSGAALKQPAHSSSHSMSQATSTSGNTRLTRRAINMPRLPRSVLLEEFRNNRDKKWELQAIFEHVVEFSGDQHGSRFIQQQLEEASDEVKDTVFGEIVPDNLNDLIRDVFGNYVIQKFFEFGNPAQINILSNAVEEQVDKLSLNIYGCRVVQKALETVSAKQQSSIIRRLDPHILTCVKDAHGNHVVQKLIEVVAPQHLTFLPSICENILELSTHPYGCRVLQRCLEHMPAEYTRSLLDAIHCHTVELMKDQYGNYVIQFILEQGQDHDKAVVLASIRGNLIRLAQHKYASNVCEKALMCTDSESREILINEIMSAKPRIPGENPILAMVKDQYANYVLQRALTLSEGRQQEVFFHQVKPLLTGLRKLTLTYSRPLVSMERLMDRYFNKHATVDSETSERTDSPTVEAQMVEISCHSH